MDKGYIYLITNLVNGKKYVGQTLMTVYARWQKHCSFARTHPNATGIDGAIRKYGEDNFSIETIKECPVSELDKWEIYYIQYYNTYQGNNSDLGYNITLGGQSGYIYDIDEDEMLQMYLEGKTAVELAQYYNCSDKTIANRLAKYNVDTKLHQKEWLKNNPDTWRANLSKSGHHFKEGDNTKGVYIKELDKSFNSLKECSQWLIDNGYTKAKSMDAVRRSLSRHLNGERGSYLKMHFEFL
jgi:group I intron endonuclease